jgi:hypothetical protein
MRVLQQSKEMLIRKCRVPTNYTDINGLKGEKSLVALELKVNSGFGKLFGLCCS